MLGSYVRRRLCSIVVVGAASAAALVGVSSLSSASTSARLSDSQLASVARTVAARDGDPAPLLVERSAKTTRLQANKLDSGDVIPIASGGDAPSYLIVEEGHFNSRGEQIPTRGTPAGGSVLTLVVNATTGHVTDGGLANRVPPLTRLGTVTRLP